ncbi:hypothetical protein BHE74_00058257 [Ensete ventricosum]|nr:hypothetical protein BHE74_00058257 [Ensete ventricosum]
MGGTYRSARLSIRGSLATGHGKVPYWAVHIGPLADQYADCLLPGRIAEIDRQRSIEGERRKRRRRGRRKKVRRRGRKIPRSHRSSPVPSRGPLLQAKNRPRDPSSTGDSFFPRGEKERGDIAPFLFFV